MRIGVPRETAAGERRVALVPEVVGKLVAGGFEVILERGAGEAASFPDASYEEAGAQPMDALSSQATVSGYKATLLAAEALPKFFPMLMTAAGTVAPAKVLVLGAGVAGLQAVATARRLGAVVTGFDVRPVVREQIESL